MNPSENWDNQMAWKGSLHLFIGAFTLSSTGTQEEDWVEVETRDKPLVVVQAQGRWVAAAVRKKPSPDWTPLSSKSCICWGRKATPPWVAIRWCWGKKKKSLSYVGGAENYPVTRPLKTPTAKGQDHWGRLTP